METARRGEGLMLVPAGHADRPSDQDGFTVVTGKTQSDDDVDYGLADQGRRCRLRWPLTPAGRCPSWSGPTPPTGTRCTGGTNAGLATAGGAEAQIRALLPDLRGDPRLNSRHAGTPRAQRFARPRSP